LIFGDKPLTLGIFGNRMSEAPRLGLGPILPPSLRARAPEFLVQRQQLRMAWWDSLKVLYHTPNLKSFKTSARPSGHFLRGVHLASYRPSGRFQSLSLAAHVAFILFLIYVPVVSRAREATFETAPPDTEKIYYRLTVLDPAQKLPKIAPAGPGAQPGKGDLVDKLPALGSTVQQHNLTVVSRPLHPDNVRQTIFQPAVPPELRITTELKLPNIVEARPVVVPKPEMNFHPKDSRPSLPNKQNVTAAAPALTATNTTTPLTDLTDPTKSQPMMPVPPPSAPAPAPTQANAAPDANSAAGLESQSQAQGSGLVVISTDPGLASDMVALPTGNRFADFSISPAGGTPGSPGGTSHGTSGVGTGGGAGGDSSSGIGKGETGGGGGNSGGAGSLSVSGTGGGGGATTLGPGVPLSMVYPVMANLLPRKNSLVVSAGPIGGGGLGVYGALHCGKIYTVFLQMPGKAWTLQFCQAGANAEKPATQTSSAVVHMEQGITPPDAEDRYDFKRMPLSEDKIHKLIVLKGLLREDGTVEGLQIHQGLLPLMDEAARLAFSKWKFKPATRGGRAIPVDILVGIPSDPPPSHPAS
jgi:Gram-negative bacterial TonB protein C-terminal